MTFTIEYNNDIYLGPDDDGFWEWWEVRDTRGELVCKCVDKSSAERICDLLNAAAALAPEPPK